VQLLISNREDYSAYAVFTKVDYYVTLLTL